MRISDWSSDVCSSDLAEPPYRLINHAEQLRAITDICRYACSRTAEVPTNFIGYRFAVCLVKLRDHHLCAFARIASRNAATDTVPSASDDRDPIFQSLHKPIPIGRVRLSA